MSGRISCTNPTPSKIQWCSAKNIYHGPPVNSIAHALNLNVNATLSTRKTRIIATLGPSTMNVDTLKMMIRSGMNIVRLNLSHGTYDSHREMISLVHQAVEELRTLLAPPIISIAIDTRGPEIRTGVLTNKQPIQLMKGDKICLTFEDQYAECSDKDHLFISSGKIMSVIRQGSRLLIDDNQICLEVQSFVEHFIECVVVYGDELGNRQSVVIPNWDMNEIPDFTPIDLKDIEFAKEMNADILMLSNVRNIEMVKRAKELTKDSGMKIIVKIEREISLSILDQLLEESNGLLIARGDLGVEVPLPKLFLIQKNLIARCNVAGKPVICSTHMLYSMEKHMQPTKSELTDVSNAVLDGCDALMLIGETAHGTYPIQCVQMMSTLAREAEHCIFFNQFFKDICLFNCPPLNNHTAISISAVEASYRLGAKLIIVLTDDGESAKLIAKFRPNACILALTKYERTAKRLNLYRSCFPVVIPDEITDTPSMVKSNELFVGMRKLVNFGVNVALQNGYIKRGDSILMIGQIQTDNKPTSLLRIITEWEDE